MFTMFTDLYTIVNMTDRKSVYSFRFSDKVLDVLVRQDNPKQFVEDLILDAPQESQQKIMEVVPLKQLMEILDEKIRDVNVPVNTPGPVIHKVPQKNISPTARTKGDVLNEIKALEAEKMEMVSQDPDDYTKINNQLNELWKEYHATKER